MIEKHEFLSFILMLWLIISNLAILKFHCFNSTKISTKMLNHIIITIITSLLQFHLSVLIAAIYVVILL